MSTILMTFSIDRALDMAVCHDFFRQASVFYYLLFSINVIVFEKGPLSVQNLHTFKFEI